MRAPRDFSIATWSAQDGLPADSVTALVQTRDGYLWVGTTHGLARFDGARFKVFNTATCPALPNNQVEALFALEDGTLMVGTQAGGLAVMRDGRFRRLAEPGMEHDFLIACEPLAPGQWLLVGRSGVLWRWADDRLTVLNTNRWAHPILPRSVCRDEQGTVWMLNQFELKGRLLRLDGNRLKPVPLQGPLAGSECIALTKDSEGRVWLGTSSGLARLRNGQPERVERPEMPEPAMIVDLLPDRDGGLWVRSENNVFRKLHQGQWVGPAVSLAGVKTFVRPLCEDRWGRLVLGGRYPEGYVALGDDGQMTRLTESDGLPGMAVACYLADCEGNEWLGFADGGLARLRPRLFSELAGARTSHVEQVRALCEDHRGDVWVGTSLGGLYRFSGPNTTHYGGRELVLTHLWSIIEDRGSNIWVGTSWYGVYQFKDDRFVKVIPHTGLPGRVNVLYEDAAGTIWLGCQYGLRCWRNGALEEQAPVSWNAQSGVTCITADSRGRLWFGTDAGGLWCRREDGPIEVIPTGPPASSPIWALYADADDTLWIGTRGNGLGRLREGRLTMVTTADGLWENTVCHIEEDSQGRLWMSSPRGVFRATKGEIEAFAPGHTAGISCIGYDRSDGMPSSECPGGFQPAGLKTRDGRLLFPTLKGVAVLRPESTVDNLTPPPVWIEDVLLDGKETRPDYARSSSGGGPDASVRTLTIPPGRGRVEIHYTALSFSDPRKVRFKCRLEGVDSDWEDVGRQRSANYSYLRPGDYRFHVRACNNDGVWNETGATLELTVLPHSWETWWFIGALLAGGATAVALTVRRVEKQKARRKLERLKYERELEHERARIARDIHDDLGASLTRMSVFSELVRADKSSPMRSKRMPRGSARLPATP